MRERDHNLSINITPIYNLRLFQNKRMKRLQRTCFCTCTCRYSHVWNNRASACTELEDLQEQNSDTFEIQYELYDWKASLIISFIVLFLVTVLNLLILIIYNARNTDANKRFVVALAVVDIVGCWVIRVLDLGRALAQRNGN